MKPIIAFDPFARKRKDDPVFRKKKQAYLTLVKNRLSGREERKKLICYLSSRYLCSIEILSEDKESRMQKEIKEKIQENPEDKENPILLLSLFDSPLIKERKEFLSTAEAPFSIRESKKEIRLYNSLIQSLRRKNSILSPVDNIEEDFIFYEENRRDIDSKKLMDGKPTYFLSSDMYLIKIILEKTIILPKQLNDNIHRIASFCFSFVELKSSFFPYQVRVRISAAERLLLEETLSPEKRKKQLSFPVEIDGRKQKLGFALTLLSKNRKEAETSFSEIVI